MTRHACATPGDVVPAPRQLSATAAPSLRICHVMSADLWAGAEVQVATMAAYQVRQPGVSVSAVLFNDGPLARELRRLGVSVTIIDETRTRAPGIVRGLTRFFREHQIDLVHTHRYKDSVLGALAAKLAGVPHVVRTVHGLREPMAGWSALKFRIYEALDRLMLLFFTDLVVAVSRGMADTLRKSGYRPTSVTQIHNGINLSAIAPRRRADQVRRELGIPPQAFVIGTAGRLSPVKGHAALLRAARLIREHRPDAVFMIVGGGPLADELRRETARLGIASACVFPGAREDVHDLVAAMDLFVLPSLSEGIPMAVLEAMALGIPVVASAVGGVPEVIQDRVNGLLVPPGDEQRLADACVELARDPASAQMLVARARRTVEERFSHEQSGRALLAAYRSVALIPKKRTHEAHDGYRNHDEHDEQETKAVRRDRRDRRGLFLRGLRPLRDLRVFERGSARIVRWWTRLAMARIRRHPAQITSRLRSARSVLILCHGNIIRSAFAARVVKAALKGSPVSIASAGLEAVQGSAADPMALRIANARGIDLDGHTASRLTPELVAASDVIFVMEVDHVVTMRRRFPEAAGRIFLLTCLAPGIALDIADPFDCAASQFHACFDQISRAASPIIRTLRERAPDTFGCAGSPAADMRGAW